MRNKIIVPRIHNEGIGDLYPLLLRLLLNAGREVAPRGFRTKEVLGVQLHAEDLTQNILVHPVRDLNYKFMVAEWAWIMAGRDDLAGLLPFNKNYGKFSDDGVKLAGAYGPQLRATPRWWPQGGQMVYSDQLQWCVEQLRRSPETRQAFALIWTPCPKPSKDIPCTIGAQFFLRDQNGKRTSLPRKLHAIFTMRSSDAWLGIPYDWFTFSMIANSMAGELGAVPGELTLQLGSSHLYEENWQAATELITHLGDLETVRSPALPSLPFPDHFSQILNHDTYSLGEPWKQYGELLALPNKKEALDALRRLAR